MRFDALGRVAAVAILAMLAGCHPFRSLARIGGTCHDPKPYMGARTVPALQIPAGLQSADTSGALKIPPLNEPAPPARKSTDPCLDEPPPFVTPKTPVPQARSIMRPFLGELA
jgi:uncharacterized lipoprotein